MEKHRHPYSLRLIMAFVISNILFILIIGAAYSVSYYNYKTISSANNYIVVSLNKFDSYLNESQCNDYVLSDSSQTLDEVGARVNLLEERFGKNDVRVLEQKKLYSEVLYRHYLVVKRVEELCNTSYISLFFFYSNNEELMDESEKMGFVLISFKKEAPLRIMIYSFDADLNTSLVHFLNNKYEIEKVPIVVYGDRQIDVKSIEDLDSILNDILESNKE